MGQNFDLDEAPARKAKNIKVLFRGVCKNPHKVIVGLQAEDRVIGKHIQENFDNVKSK
tara:strand:+ start:135 stop:308 length:174 start_codon:yes stop_codon:yes gene_type:complete